MLTNMSTTVGYYFAAMCKYLLCSHFVAPLLVQSKISAVSSPSPATARTTFLLPCLALLKRVHPGFLLSNSISGMTLQFHPSNVIVLLRLTPKLLPPNCIIQLIFNGHKIVNHIVQQREILVTVMGSNYYRRLSVLLVRHLFLKGSKSSHFIMISYFTKV